MMFCSVAKKGIALAMRNANPIIVAVMKNHTTWPLPPTAAAAALTLAAGDDAAGEDEGDDEEEEEEDALMT